MTLREGLAPRVKSLLALLQKKGGYRAVPALITSHH
jgi:hypothetical protein